MDRSRKPRTLGDEEQRLFQDDAKRKQYRPKPAQRLGDVLSALLARKGYARILSSSAMDDTWRQAVGAKFAGHTRCGEVNRGVLQVIVRNSAVLQELTFDKSGIVKRLVAAAPEKKIKDVKFRIGSID